MAEPLPAYVAVVVVAETEDRAHRIAIYIGTDKAPAGPGSGVGAGEAPKWQAGVLDADDFEGYLTGRKNKPEPAVTLFDLAPDMEHLEEWLAAGPVGISDGHNAKLDPRIFPTAGPEARRSLWIDRVVRVHFFSFKAAFTFGGGLPEPLARFDTAGFVIDEESRPVDDPVWAVSRLRLDATTSWPECLAGGQAVKLESYRLVAHIPLALNAHESLPDDGARAKRYDTRALFFAEAVRTKQLGQLWFAGAPERGPGFRALALGFSTADGLILEGPDVPSKNRGATRALADLVGDGKAYLSKGAEDNEPPLFAYLPAFRQTSPGYLSALRREIGLRRISSGQHEPSPRLLLRAEVHFGIAGNAGWAEAWNAVVRPVAGLEKPDSLKTGKEATCFLLAQEQPREVLKLDLRGANPVSWIVTARVEQSGLGSIEGLIFASLRKAQELTHGPLRPLRPASGISTLPSVEPGGGTAMPWYVVAILSGPGHERRIYRGGGRAPWSVAAHPKRRLELQSFEPCRVEDLWAKAPQWLKRPVTIKIETIARSDGKALELASRPVAVLQAFGGDDAYEDRLAAQRVDWQPRLAHGIMFRLATQLSAASQRLRIGAFEFDLAGGARLVQKITLPQGQASYRLPSALTLETTLVVKQVVPVEQDRMALRAGQSIADAVMAEPILLQLEGAPSPAEALKLVGTEAFGHIDQEVSWSLRGTVADMAGKVLVIDPQPFRIAAVEYTLGSSDESVEIANWNRGDDGVSVWRITDPRQTVRMVLPPQIVGEAMEKRKTGAGIPDDIAPGKPAAARFGSLTRIDLDPTYRDTLTHEPGWNLRRLLNRVTDAASGALVRDLRFELAYGMLVRHLPQRETWLSEIGGVIGEAPVRFDDKVEPRAFALYANRVLEAQFNRLAVDKVWTGRPEDSFETTEGLSFTLRRKKGPNGPRTKFRFPVTHGFPPARMPTLPPSEEPELSDTFEDPEAASAGSFPGGIPFAFESPNILQEVYGSPVTSDGRIGDVYFSALGGWGRQRAAFAEGKSIVETETAMGRMSYYKLERLGRIGGLGNRAKHVIVYRRSVAPSGQFYNKDPIGLKQDEHAGRPILRKVEEYVDILEPERRYPDKGSAATREAGCLAGNRFVSRRILVDSDWGGDVRNEGWMVPLWRTIFAPRAAGPADSDPDSPANLYKKPLVQLLMPGEDGREVAIGIETPERLVFYTSTVKGETADNLEDWHAVEGIDFCDAPHPALETLAPDSARLHDGMLPPAPREAAGHERLTLGLTDAKLPVRLGAGRVEAGPAASLKTITISRARPRTLALVPDAAPNGPMVPATREDAARAAGQKAAKLAADMRGRFDAVFGHMTRAFEALGTEVPGGRARAEKAVNDVRAELIGELFTLHADLAADARKLTQDLTRVDGLIEDALAGKLVESLRGQLQSERTRLREAIAGRQDNTGAWVGGAINLAAAHISGRAADVSTLLARKVDELIDGLLAVAVDQPVAEIQTRFRGLIDGELKPRFAAAGADVEALVTEIEQGLERIFPNADLVARQLDLRPALTQLKQETGSILARALHSAQDVRGEVAGWQPFGDPAEVETKRRQILAYIADARRDAHEASVRLERLATDRGARPGAADAALKALLAGLRTVEGFLTDLTREAEAFPSPQDFDALKSRIDALLAQAETLIHGAQAGLAGLLGNVLDANNALLAALSDYLTSVRTAAWHSVLDPVKAKAQEISDALVEAERLADALLTAQGNTTAEAAEAAHDAANQLRDKVSTELRNWGAVLGAALRQCADTMHEAAAPADALIGDTIKAIVEEARVFQTVAAAPLTAADALVTDLQRQVADTLGTSDEITAEIKAQIDSFADALLAAIGEVADTVEAARAAVEEAVADQGRRMANKLESYLGGVQREIARQVGVEPGDLVEGVAIAAERGRYLYQEGDNVLRLIRAVGDPPKTDGLGFNRPEVAYVFDALKPIVDVTPVVALANRVTDQVAGAEQAARAAGQLLEPFGLRLPVNGLGDDLVPEALKGLSLSKLFPDMAGIDLEGLLRNAGFPDLSGTDAQGVKVTRGFDKERREAWLAADINVKLSKSEAVLDFGPVALMIDGGQFRAQTRIAIAADGRAEKEAKGQISGDWRLVTGGMDIITFEKTPLLFDKSGKIDFKIASDRIKLAPTLEFLTNLMASVKKAAPPGIEPIMRGGVPAGLVTRLSMQMPPLQTGAFAVTDLTLGASFAVIAHPEFEIATTLDVGSRDAPFTLAVWLLNGGGYISQRLSYLPTAKPRPLLTYTLDVAIVAGVGIGFGFGVVSGGVWLQVGCSVALTWTTGAGGNVTTVTAFLLARGNVDVAGLVSANIMLRMEISYDGSVMIARGTLRLSFRISMFYTLRVAQAAQYKLMGERRKIAESEDYSQSFG